jgi:hypothetical protein
VARRGDPRVLTIVPRHDGLSESCWAAERILVADCIPGDAFNAVTRIVSLLRTPVANSELSCELIYSPAANARKINARIRAEDTCEWNCWYAACN